MAGDLWRLNANEILGAVSSGQESAQRVVIDHLDRIERINPTVNAITSVLTTGALAAAQAIDDRRAAGELLPRMAGLPFSVKGNIDVAGVPTTHGIPAMASAVPTRDAPLVQRFRDAGAIPIATTNLPDLGLRFHTASQLFGETRNPWCRNHSPGGSSGGEAVAVATGMSPLGVGNDAGGSVRVPALFAGVAALKPTTGRVASDRSVGPRDPTIASQFFPVEGLFARRIADLRTITPLLIGHDPRDPRSIPVPYDWRWARAKPKAALISATADGIDDPDVSDSLNTAAEALRRAGWSIDVVSLPRLYEASEGFERMAMTEFASVWPQLRGVLSVQVRRYLELSMERSPPVGLDHFLRLSALRHAIGRDWAEFFEKYDVAICPVYTEALMPLGADIENADSHGRCRHAVRYCTSSTFVGVPAVAVPTGIRGRTPTGVQIISGLWRENLCLDAAEVIEAAVGPLAPIDPREHR